MANKNKDVEPKQRAWPIPPAYVALISVCLFCAITFYALGTFRPTKHQVAGVDPVAYYSWVRSIMFDFDLDFTNEFQRFDPRTEGEGAELTVRGAETPIGRVGNMFAMGAGLLWMPFLLVARLFAESSDGFGPTYYAAISIANFVYGCAGLFLMFGALRRWFSEGVAAGAAIAAWACSPVLYYTFAQYSMSHACSFFAVALFFYLWARWRGSDDWWRWGIIGLAVGLAAIVRWQNITLALVVAVDVLARRDVKHWPKAVASAAGAAANVGCL